MNLNAVSALWYTETMNIELSLNQIIFIMAAWFCAGLIFYGYYYLYKKGE